jgi:putative phosphoribosyl transferase
VKREDPAAVLPFADRTAAGRALAELLRRHENSDAVVLALPRGGVPIGREVANLLGVPLDVLVVRKVGAPTEPEYGLGALTEGGSIVLDEHRIRELGLRPADLAGTIEEGRRELKRRVEVYRGGRTPIEVRDRVVILVDDGLATGGTMRAAVQLLRQRAPRRIIVAVAVGPPEAAALLRREADELVILATPPEFEAVGQFYRDFEPVSDEEVVRLLRPSHHGGADRSSASTTN